MEFVFDPSWGVGVYAGGARGGLAKGKLGRGGEGRGGGVLAPALRVSGEESTWRPGLCSDTSCRDPGFGADLKLQTWPRLSLHLLQSTGSPGPICFITGNKHNQSYGVSRAYSVPGTVLSFKCLVTFYARSNSARQVLLSPCVLDEQINSQA